MLLPGRLELSTLGDVLGMLSRAQVTGSLQLTEQDGPSAGRTHAVHLISGRPAAVASDGPRLGELLSERDTQLTDAIRSALRRQSEGDARLVGELLFEGDAGATQAVGEGMRVQTRLRLDGLFSLRRAKMRFSAIGLGDSQLVSLMRAAKRALPLSIEDYLVGRPRRRPGTERPIGERIRDLAVLGLGPDAAAGRVKQAFRALVIASHPDRANNDRDRAALTSRLREITAAYSRLSLSGG